MIFSWISSSREGFFMVGTRLTLNSCLQVLGRSFPELQLSLLCQCLFLDLKNTSRVPWYQNVSTQRPALMDDSFFIPIPSALYIAAFNKYWKNEWMMSKCWKNEWMTPLWELSGLSSPQTSFLGPILQSLIQQMFTEWLLSEREGEILCVE